jgi:hypothetical protein
MQEEKRPLDPTRRLLRVFGVKVTEYEERTTGILERASTTDQPPAEELLQMALEIADQTAELNARLREMTTHVLDTESRVLGELKAVLEREARRNGGG